MTLPVITVRPVHRYYSETADSNCRVHLPETQCKALVRALRNDSTTIVPIDEALAMFPGRKFEPCKLCYRQRVGSQKQPRLPWGPLDEYLRANTADYLTHTNGYGSRWAQAYADHTGMHTRTINRAKTAGHITVSVAERMCENMGVLCVEVWPDFYELCADQVAAA